MAYTAITADANGRLYWIDHEGILQRSPDGDLNGNPEPIGNGWNGIKEFGVSLQDGGPSLLARTYDDTHVALDGNGHPAPATWTTGGDPDMPARRRILRSLTGTASGTFLGVAGGGHLLEVRTAPLGPSVEFPVPRSGIEIVTRLASVSRRATRILVAGTRVFRVNGRGQLCYRAKRLSDGALVTDGTLGPWVVLEAGWSAYQRVLVAGPHALYAITSEGDVLRREFNDDGHHVTLSPNAPTCVRTGLNGWYGLPCLVEAYVTPYSLAPGANVKIHLAARHSPEAVLTTVPCNVEIVHLRRTRQAQGVDGDRAIAAPVDVVAPVRERPANWIHTGVGWPSMCDFTIPEDLPAGIYAARCTDKPGERFYAPFIVHPKTKQHDFAVLANTNTWNAYNSWGGKGKYHAQHEYPFTFTFERPHPGLHPDAPPVPECETELRNQSLHLLRAELWVLGWLDTLGDAFGYDVYSDIDVHQGVEGLTATDETQRYKALILNTHPEYWSRTMYDHVRNYLTTGGSILYLGGNGIYETMDFAENGALRAFPSVGPDKSGNTPHNDLRNASLARFLRMPERALIGVGFEAAYGGSQAGTPFKLACDPKHPLLEGTHLKKNAEFGRSSVNPRFSANGWEVDRRGAATPPAACGADALIATGPHSSAGGEMLFYETGHGGVVFSVSSLNFGGSLAVDHTLQQIVRNVLEIARNP